MNRGSCTSLDHCYPQNAPGGKTAPGTPCYCGKGNVWGGGERRVLRRLKNGDSVTVLGRANEGARTIVGYLRDDAAYVLDAPVGGRKYYERAELEEAR